MASTTVVFIGGSFDGKKVLFPEAPPPVYAIGVVPTGNTNVDVDLITGSYRLIALNVSPTFALAFYVYQALSDLGFAQAILSGKYSIGK